MKRLAACLVMMLALTLVISARAETGSVRVQEVTSPGGIKAWLVEDEKLPLVTLRFAFRGGVEQDPKDKQGLAEITSALMTQGAGPYDAQAFQQQLADRSIVLSFDAGRDAIHGSLKTLRLMRRQAFDLLRLALSEPRFDASAFDLAQKRQETAIRLELGNANWQGRRALFAALFKDHPYAQRRLGTKETLNALSREDAATFASAHFARDNLVVAAAGAITPTELAQALDDLFGKLPAKASLAPMTPVPQESKGISVLVNRQGTQTDTLFAIPMMKRSDPDWYVAEIANYILGGGGFSSRLMTEVRDKAGLTYGIGTGLAAMDYASVLMGQASTDNDKTGKAWEKTLNVWRAYYAHGATEDEVAAAKDFMTGSLPLTLTTTSAIAGVLLNMQLENLGRDYLDRRNDLIRKATLQDVNRVIKQWFNPDNVSVVMVGAPQGMTFAQTMDEVKE